MNGFSLPFPSLSSDDLLTRTLLPPTNPRDLALVRELYQLEFLPFPTAPPDIPPPHTLQGLASLIGPLISPPPFCSHRGLLFSPPSSHG